MNNSLYEEYMRSVLGYNMPDYRNSYNYNDMNFNSNFNVTSNEEIEKCYPDIYRLVYPMIQKACAQNNRPISRELIDSMTDEIYFSIEDNEITQDTRNKDTNNNAENRQRVVRNRTLNDLIRILLLRELLGRPGFPGRPPRPRPPRPPMRPPHPRLDMNTELYGYEMYENNLN